MASEPVEQPVYTVDWTSWHFPNWRRWLGHLVGKPKVHGLEIGVFEGMASVWFLSEILTGPESSLTTIDPHSAEVESGPWQGSLQGSYDASSWAGVKERFLQNVWTWYHRGQLLHLANTSREGLFALHVARDSGACPPLDFVYVDGSHTAPSVIEDSVLVWPLLKPGGVLIWDDYLWEGNKPAPAGVPEEVMRPKLAIDSFLRIFAGQYTDREESNTQLKIRKR